MKGLRSDLVYAARRLRRSPGFAVVSCFALALGIGAATTGFGLVNGLFLRPLPEIARQDRLVTLHPNAASSLPTLRDLGRAPSTLSGVAGFVDRLLGVQGDAGAVRALGLLVSEEYFPVLGTRPALGRLLGPGDERVVVLGHRFWRTEFGGDSAVVGRTLRVNGAPLTVAGVAPPGFIGIFAGLRFDLWVPLSAAAALGAADLERRDAHRLQLVARLADGATPQRARAEMESLARGLAATHGELPPEFRIQVRRFTGFDEDLRAGASLVVGALFGLGALLLLLAVANVAGMLVVRGLDRAEETALRRILGGTAGRSARPLWIETALISLAGGGAGLALAARGARALEGAASSFPVPLGLDFGVDARVAAFALGLSALTAAGAGLLPALRPREATPPGGRVAGLRSRTRLRRTFVMCQVSLSVVLLIVAGLFVRSLRAATERPVGFEIEGVHVAPFVDLSLAGLGAEAMPEARREILDRISALPAVEAAAWSTAVPLDFRGMARAGVRADGAPPPSAADDAEAALLRVSSGFFRTMGVPLQAGRDFEDRARTDPAREAGEAGDPAGAIVSAALANRLWPDSDPLGRRLSVEGRSYRVIGLAADVRRSFASPEPSPALYLPLGAADRARASLLIRSAAPSGAIVPLVRSAVREAYPALPPVEPRPLASHLALSLLPQRLGAAAGATLGGLGLLLSGLGLYGALAFAMARRRREIGIRLAVGARPRHVLALAIREGIVPTALGVALGAMLGVGLGHLLRALLPGVSPADPAALGAAFAALVTVAGLAGIIPARRALRVDPATTLRDA